MRTVTLAILVGALLAVSVAGATWSPAVDGQAVDADTVLMQVDLQDSGAATWTVAYRVRLDSDDETVAFEELRADVRDNESRYASAFRDRMTATVDAAADSTGRAMSVENVSADARIEAVPRSTGVLTYQFTWTEFARSEGDRLIAGDALAGLYLDSNTVLTVAWPSEYDTTQIAPAGEGGNRSVTWYGPRDFGPNEPRVAVAPGATPGDPASESQSPVLAIVAAIVAITVGLAGAYWWYARRNGGDADARAAVATDSSDSASEEIAAETDATDDGDATDSGDADDPAGGPPFDQSLLRNDEQVVRLLEANDGRMKQQAIAATLDWTDAKTSQVIGDLRDEDAVETFRIGRENVVELTVEDDSNAP